MAGTNTMDGNLQVRGAISADSFNLPTNTVGDQEAKADDPFDVDKVVHQYCPLLAQVQSSAATAERRPIHVARGAGVLREFRCGVAVANIGDSTITMNLYKNGASVLSGGKVLDSTNTAYTVATGSLTVSPTPYNDGDVFEVGITVAAGSGTLGRGAWGQGVFEEEHD